MHYNIVIYKETKNVNHVGLNSFLNCEINASSLIHTLYFNFFSWPHKLETPMKNTKKYVDKQDMNMTNISS